MGAVSAKTLTKILAISNFKKMVEVSFQNPSRTRKMIVPRNIRAHFKVSEFKIMGKAVITVLPNINVSNTHILFFHGGGYVLEGSSMHWKIIENIVTAANCKLSYIDYPLAPENTYKTTFEMVEKSFERLICDYPDDNFMLMGDSAGGGLATAFAQKLATENALVQPSKIILFSPWLDMTMDNSEIMKLETLDKVLSVKVLRHAAQQYSGGDNLSQYLLSPINGDFKGLGKTMVFYGTHEILYADCLQLKEKTKGLSNFYFEEFDDMQHDWIIFPIPEAKQALQMAVAFIIG